MYGSVESPFNFGSRGSKNLLTGAGQGVCGGGILKLSADVLYNDGLVSANGQPSSYGGGGSGGIPFRYLCKVIRISMILFFREHSFGSRSTGRLWYI